jgi:hypothetical protein
MSAGSKMEKGRLAFTVQAAQCCYQNSSFLPPLFSLFPKERSFGYELSQLNTRNKELMWLGTYDFSVLFNTEHFSVLFNTEHFSVLFNTEHCSVLFNTEHCSVLFNTENCCVLFNTEHLRQTETAHVKYTGAVLFVCACVQGSLDIREFRQFVITSLF